MTSGMLTEMLLGSLHVRRSNVPCHPNNCRREILHVLRQRLPPFGVHVSQWRVELQTHDVHNMKRCVVGVPLLLSAVYPGQVVVHVNWFLGEKAILRPE